MSRQPSNQRSDIYSRITTRIIADLEQGVRPWTRPWTTGQAASEVSRPLRHNGQPYSGINVLLLWSQAIARGGRSATSHSRSRSVIPPSGEGPIGIVARAVWLYFRFNLSLRDVEEMMLDCGIVVSHETIRRWCRKNGHYGRRTRHKASTEDDVWYLDEVVVRVNGQKCCGERLIRMDMCSMRSCSRAATPRRPSACWRDA